jgi:RNA polymerase sigma-70 factor (ECF subfamily)
MLDVRRLPHVIQDDFSTLCAPHLDWLQRWFAVRGIDPDTSDDLAQETIVEAWRRRDRLYDCDGMRPWLGAIARNILLRWYRGRGRYLHRTDPILHHGPDLLADLADPAPEDPLDAIEQQDLQTFLLDALWDLPPTDRDLLLARYGAELSVAAIGDLHQVTPAHAAVRLQRARLRLRAALEAKYAPELATLGIDVTPPAWRSTRLWCPHCGIDHLRMELDRTNGAFALACPVCCAEPGHYLYNWKLVDGEEEANPLRSARTPSEALDRTIRRSGWNLPQRGEQRCCPDCATPVQIRAQFPAGIPQDLSHLQLIMLCPSCGALNASATFGGMATFHPDGLAFWRAMGRVRTHPPMLARFDQRDAVRVDLVSVETQESRSFFIDASGERLLGVVTDA